VPCLICAGDADEMHDDAKRAAEEIPALPGPVAAFAAYNSGSCAFAGYGLTALEVR
jgi:hypothetical protein